MQSLADEIFSRYLRDRPKVELSIGVSYGPEPRYAFLSGAQSPFAGIDKNSLFEVGSISKTFAAMLLEKAVLSGYAEMTTPVQEVVPELREVVASSMNVQQLAVHTSGLPYDFPYRMTKEARQEDRDPWAKLTRDDLFGYLATAKTDVPGRKWRYSNIGYSVLAIALEKIYGADYPDILRRHVFEPLQMYDTVSSTQVVECATHGHCGRQQSPYSESALLYGPGDIRSSVHDMLLYLDSAMYPDRVPYENFGQHLFTPTAEEKPVRIRQGLGWGLYEEDRGWIVLADGATAGFSCSAIFSPVKRKAVVVLANHIDIGGFRELLRAWMRKNGTVHGATQLLFDAV